MLPKHSSENSEPSRSEFSITRRTALFGFGSALLGAAGCSTIDLSAGVPAMSSVDMAPTGAIRPQISIDRNVTNPELMYASFEDSGFVLPAIPYQKVKPEFRRQIVVDPTGEAPGTLVVDTKNRYLYLVQTGGEALRYGVGIGKAGFEWSGRGVIQYGRKWPTWTPPKEMIARKPEVGKWAGGQPGGLDNPLGARALYIYRDNQDTGYRVHGSPEWWTIGQAMSSGCVRMMNQDVIDLFDRVNSNAVMNKTQIVVL
ncbi:MULTISPECIES: L,D-transpeptidase [Mesorhizobium]|uniref:L,D-transpeptidase n=1 Tax=Mesorhizobium denitrificans TaxID=2294114 RepID=A0A371XCK4_9HYPH|nr:MULTISPECIES: L,D-transpeptidase [Mesorhizobium]RFC66960.1 L,D-transpeptidase [Mesorhizobium denitrificans]